MMTLIRRVPQALPQSGNNKMLIQVSTLSILICIQPRSIYLKKKFVLIKFFIDIQMYSTSDIYFFIF